MNDGLIYPDIFGGFGVTAFFTGKTVGIDQTKFPLTSHTLYMPVQKHTATVIVLRKGDVLDYTLTGDAVVTDREDVMAGVRTADCVPILLYDSVKGLAGAIHAGWRGTGQAILKATIKVFTEEFASNPEDILIAVGPSIGGCCYEVGDEVVDAVTTASGPGDYATVRNGRLYVDLVLANTAQALSLNVRRENIWTSGSCTFCDSEHFHSFRKEGTRRGSQGGFICLAPR